ncbi:hypothetical protein [Streptomyces vietnamensis]|uniref:hypothetical protein n=1 Tax=Streptomyces vietnamensis TaxID=362257 RepID=UPI000AADC920|nr:hypothetical protein [Streptomyces vietnamensis]
MREFVKLALSSGGPDNVTLIVADVLDLRFGDNAAAQFSAVPIVVGEYAAGE